MIFVTVGSMLPFDRFVSAMDDWADRHPEVEVFAQIGGGSYKPRMPHASMMSPSEFSANVRKAELIVAHAGMGSVITSAEAGKSIVLFPRRASLGEHTTDHQLHTVQWLKERPGIYVAMETRDLDARIAQAIDEMKGTQSMGTTAPESFIRNIRKALLD
jgi:UDP-N-acetylglucosamine transferase subunit ALG13